MQSPTEHSIATRSSLINRLHDWKDQRSWQDFYDTYWRLIYSVALRAGLSETEAQEVVQETIITIAKSIQGFRYDPKIGSFKGWLRNITRWRIADQFRKRTRRPGDEPPAVFDANELPAESDPEHEATWELEWRENLLKSALERVKRKVRAEHFQIFDLYALRQWPVSKVATTLGVSVPKVYVAKHRVAALLKKEIKALENGRNWEGCSEHA